MPRVVITAEVKDIEAWEKGFRTHGDLFRSQAAISPVRYATNSDDNHIAI